MLAVCAVRVKLDRYSGSGVTDEIGDTASNGIKLTRAAANVNMTEAMTHRTIRRSSMHIAIGQTKSHHLLNMTQTMK